MWGKQRGMNFLCFWGGVCSDVVFFFWGEASGEGGFLNSNFTLVRASITGESGYWVQDFG